MLDIPILFLKPLDLFVPLPSMLLCSSFSCIDFYLANNTTTIHIINIELISISPHFYLFTSILKFAVLSSNLDSSFFISLIKKQK